MSMGCRGVPRRQLAQDMTNVHRVTGYPEHWRGCIAGLTWEERNVAVDGKRCRYVIDGGDDDDDDNGIKNKSNVNLSVITLLFSFVLFFQCGYKRIRQSTLIRQITKICPLGVVVFHDDRQTGTMTELITTYDKSFGKAKKGNGMEWTG